MCREIESACKGSGRECVCLERVGECTETEREMESVCREREWVRFEIEVECRL